MNKTNPLEWTRDHKLSILTLLADISTFTRNMPDDADWSEICKLETAREELLTIHDFLYPRLNVKE